MRPADPVPALLTVTMPSETTRLLGDDVVHRTYAVRWYLMFLFCTVGEWLAQHVLQDLALWRDIHMTLIGFLQGCVWNK